jgi:predicted DNA-binding ArsR family transcriptional regulator
VISYEKSLFDFDKCEALKLLKEMLIFENKWKEKSQAKKPSKDKTYQQTLKVIKLLKEC